MASRILSKIMDGLFLVVSTGLAYCIPRIAIEKKDPIFSFLFGSLVATPPKKIVLSLFFCIEQVQLKKISNIAMWNKLRLAALLVALGVSTITAQNALQDPVVYFSKQVEGDVGYGNGLFLYEQLLVATSSDGTVTCFHALTGEELWEYSPQSSSEIASHSGVAFTTENAETPYMVYSIIENENSLTPMRYVDAIES